MDYQSIRQFLEKVLFRDITFFVAIIAFIITDRFLFNEVLQRIVQIVHIFDFKGQIIE